MAGLLLVQPLVGAPFQLAVRRVASGADVASALARRLRVPTSAFRLCFRGKYVQGAATPFADAARDEPLRMVPRAPLLGGGCATSRPRQAVDESDAAGVTLTLAEPAATSEMPVKPLERQYTQEQLEARAAAM